MNNFMEELFASLQERSRPEDIWLKLKKVLVEQCTEDEREFIYNIQSIVASQTYQHSYMQTTFQKPVAPFKQIYKAQELFTTSFKIKVADDYNVTAINELLDLLSKEINKVREKNNFVTDRLTKEERKQTFSQEVSKRRYNKLFRFLKRFEKKLITYKLELRKYQAMRVAKSRLATFIDWNDFKESPEASYFVAYFSARMNRRSEFTNQSQNRPYDEVAAWLLDRFKKNPCQQGWKIIAQVMPDEEIVSNLTAENKALLFSQYLTLLYDVADLLKITWEKSKFNRASMIVKAGDDSTTWNALAGDWNRLREGWLALVKVLGMTDIYEQFCIGKVMRLMAADVAYWHRMTGGTIEPDTLVWAELPAPWEVLMGEETCEKALVIKTCEIHGVDAIEKGWIEPKQNREIVPFTLTPELVHGVVVNNPDLAFIFRKLGMFSGK